jgi:hypothetical protein
MPDLRQTKSRLKLAFGALALIDVAAIVVIFSPWVGSQQSRREHMNGLWTELQQKTREVEPLRGLDKKIPAAQLQIADFYKNRLTSQDSEISSSLGKLAQETGVTLAEVKYNQKENDRDADRAKKLGLVDPSQVGLQRVTIEAQLQGNYLQLIRFVNALERNRLLFLVDKLELGDREGNNVKLNMTLESYLKTGTS